MERHLFIAQGDAGVIEQFAKNMDHPNNERFWSDYGLKCDLLFVEAQVDRYMNAADELMLTCLTAIRRRSVRSSFQSLDA